LRVLSGLLAVAGAVGFFVALKYRDKTWESVAAIVAFAALAVYGVLYDRR
jgi:hypothetical protein